MTFRFICKIEICVCGFSTKNNGTRGSVPSGRLKVLDMRKKLLYVIVAIISMLCLCGCGNKFFEGEVCELRFEEEYTTTILLPTNIYNGKTMQTILIPYIRTYPDRWYVRVRTFNTEKQNYEYNACYVTK